MTTIGTTDKILIVGIAPYFLERENFWFEENLEKILAARKTQSFFEDNIIAISKNSASKLSEFLRKLDEMGYEKVFEVREPGEFSSRGGIIDIFPINLNQAVRIEFYGNSIENIAVFGASVEDEKKAKDRLKKKLKNQKIYSQLGILKPGEYLVHLDHGVGMFQSETEIDQKKYYILHYAAGDKLYVPKELNRKLSRYVGFTKPSINRLGSSIWEKTKRKAKDEAEKLAKELLEIYAKREVATRQPYSRNSELEFKVRETFPYLETPDQNQAMLDIAKDLEESEVPMDRIVCGDVGFGKTEIALRAMMKGVSDNRQTAMICPTTVLASQHYHNFKSRIRHLPVRIALISRMQSKKEQKNIVEDLRAGKTDIVIGTHRLLSHDIEFKNLGMLIVDDEQRFGVEQKEKLKKIRPSLDILSLSATPIPRTLYFALSSLKNITIVKTPPHGRVPIKTYIERRSEKTVKKAIRSEISRKGQVYYLHNKVETIGAAKEFINKLVPEAKIGTVHGRMNGRQLLKTMNEFQERKINVLVATTIIENGLDLPGVNTIIVSDASGLGLSQAYQIRGRVGRSNTQAFAYFLHNGRLNNLAKERMTALKQANTLGLGYQIALRDMEIRGAGNILGKEQSGNINQVGLNLYCQMLSDAIEKMKNR